MDHAARSIVEPAQSAVTALLDYCIEHRNHEGLIDALQSLASDLNIALTRLQARSSLLFAEDSPMSLTAAIVREFAGARNWLTTNTDNIKSRWSPTQAEDAVREFSAQLASAFVTKFVLVLIEAVQDSRAVAQQLHIQLDSLSLGQSRLGEIVRDASGRSLRQTIELLEEEQAALRTAGYSSKEADRIFGGFVDQLSTAADEAGRRNTIMSPTSLYSTAPPAPNGYTPTRSPPPEPGSSAIPRHLYSPDLVRHGSGSSFDGNGTGTYGGGTTFMSAGVGTYNSSMSSSTYSSDQPLNKGKERERPRQAPIIGFNPIDPVSRLELVDPVLCTDGLIHDRWSVLLSPDLVDPKTKQPLRIVGEVIQLKEAIQKMFPARREEYEQRRSHYRTAALDLCGPRNHHELGKLLTHLSHCLLWDPSSTQLLVRRGVARYRVRNLTGALEDLTSAIDIASQLSSSSGSQELVDALRFRALARETCHDHEGAREDLHELLLRQRKPDALALALSASLRASVGDLEGAEEDLAASTEALHNRGFQLSEILSENEDLVHTCRGWGYSSIGRFDQAVESFDTALQTRMEPYALASRGLALIHVDDVESGLLALDEAIEWADSHAELSRPSPTVMQPNEASDIGRRPAILFQLYFLRAMAYYREGRTQDALNDFETGIELRPAGVKDTGEFRFVLGCLRAEVGDPAATTDFDFACALKPECRDDYERERARFSM